MDLTTTYLGLKLKNPLVPSAMPMMESVDNIKKLAEAGASAVVLHSLFEEQISNEAMMLHYHTTQSADTSAEALSYFPEPSTFKLDGEQYLEHIRKVKKTIDIPVIASLNGTSTGGWLKYAKYMQDAGADAIELNMYYIPTDPAVTSDILEAVYIDIIKAVKAQVTIPVAVKMSPFFTSIPNMAKRMVDAGADGLVLFNRFYQPDIDIDKREIRAKINLSNSAGTRMAQRWIAILHGRLHTSFAATGGVHTAADAIKLIMTGADVTMMASALLLHGPAYLKAVLDDMNKWLIDNEYESVEQMKGSMNQFAIAEPAAYERALYLKELKSYHY